MSTTNIPHRNDCIVPTSFNSSSGDGGISYEEQSIGLSVFKGLGMALIIISTIIGNLMVVTAVSKYRWLRTMNNYFIVSLALADLLVGMLVQPFNMYNEMVQGDWKFGHTMCNLYNANDVFFSTSSLLHLCCISCDRYVAILHPFLYERVITRTRVLLMIVGTWILSALLAYVPIFSGWYTTDVHLEHLKSNPTVCTFEVTQQYAFISSSISFWVPTTIMIILYQRILKTALRQQREIQLTMIQSMSLHNSNSHNNNSEIETTVDLDKQAECGNSLIRNENNNSFSDRQEKSQVRKMRKLQKEYRAVKTLGIIMGCFILCMGPIFLWYTITFGICPSVCKLSDNTKWVIPLVFWIGYFNSCMNPFVYAFFNRDFKRAFKRLIYPCWKAREFIRRHSTVSEMSIGPPSPNIRSKKLKNTRQIDETVVRND